MPGCKISPPTDIAVVMKRPTAAKAAVDGAPVPEAPVGALVSVEPAGATVTGGAITGAAVTGAAVTGAAVTGAKVSRMTGALVATPAVQLQFVVKAGMAGQMLPGINPRSPANSKRRQVLGSWPSISTSPAGFDTLKSDGPQTLHAGKPGLGGRGGRGACATGAIGARLGAPVPTTGAGDGGLDIDGPDDTDGCAVSGGAGPDELGDSEIDGDGVIDGPDEGSEVSLTGRPALVSGLGCCDGDALCCASTTEGVTDGVTELDGARKTVGGDDDWDGPIDADGADEPPDGTKLGFTEGSDDGSPACFEGNVEGNSDARIDGAELGKSELLSTDGDDDGIVDDIARGMVEGIVDGIVDDIACGMVEGVVDGIVDDITTGMVDGSVDGMVDDTATGIVEGSVDGMATGVVEGSVVGAADGWSEGTMKTVGETDAVGFWSDGSNDNEGTNEGFADGMVLGCSETGLDEGPEDGVSDAVGTPVDGLNDKDGKAETEGASGIDGTLEGKVLGVRDNDGCKDKLGVIPPRVDGTPEGV